jgi:DNA-binding CsgD family transcriptional regulator
MSEPTSDPRVSAGIHFTPRQAEIMHLLRAGYRNQEIATELGIRLDTVKGHLRLMFALAGLRGRGNRVKLATF